MDFPVISSDPGGRALTPAEVKARYFDFFPAGSHREVLLLGDVVEALVHRVRSKGHNVLCGARSGRCELCEKAAESDDVGNQRVEFYAPAYIRGMRDREFVQKLAVLSNNALEQLMKLHPDSHFRGKVLEVRSFSRGSSTRYQLKSLPPLPPAFLSLLPIPFDPVPFVLARYGKALEPGKPMVFLPPFKAEHGLVSITGRPRQLTLTAEQCRPDQDEIATMRAMMANRLKEEPVSPPVQTPAPKPTPTLQKPPVTPTPERVGAALQRRLSQISTEDAARRKELSQKPPEELTAGEAVEAGRIFDFVLGGPESKNGHATKGGAQ